MLFTITYFLHWPIEYGWLSMAYTEFQGPVLTLTALEMKQDRKMGKLWGHKKGEEPFT